MEMQSSIRQEFTAQALAKIEEYSRAAALAGPDWWVAVSPLLPTNDHSYAYTIRTCRGPVTADMRGWFIVGPWPNGR
jgi:hypothetical protein